MRRFILVFLLSVNLIMQVLPSALAVDEMQVTLVEPAIGQNVVPYAPFDIKLKLTGGPATTANKCSDEVFNDFKFGAQIIDGNNIGIPLGWGIPNNSSYSTGGWFGYGWDTQILSGGIMCTLHVLNQSYQSNYGYDSLWGFSKTAYDDVLFSTASGTQGEIKTLDIAWKNSNLVTHNIFQIKHSGYPQIVLSGLTRGQVIDYSANFSVEIKVGDSFVFSSIDAKNNANRSTTSCGNSVKIGSSEGLTTYRANCVIAFRGGETDSTATIEPVINGLGRVFFVGEKVTVNIGKQGDGVAAAAAEKAAAEKAAAEKAAAEKAAAEKAAAEKAAAAAVSQANMNSLTVEGVSKTSVISYPTIFKVRSIASAGTQSMDFVRKFSINIGGEDQPCGTSNEVINSLGLNETSALCRIVPHITSNLQDFVVLGASSSGKEFKSLPISITTTAFHGMSFLNSIGVSTLRIIPIKTNGKQLSATIKGKLSLLSDSLPPKSLVNTTISICVEGNNPFTGNDSKTQCVKSKADLNGEISQKVALPNTYKVRIEVKSISEFPEYDFEGQDNWLEWSNSTYIAQLHAQEAADKRAAAAASAAEQAANRRASNAAYTRAYNMILNTSVGTLFQTNFYRFLSPPGNSMTIANAKAWCYWIKPYDEIYTSWIDGCAKAAQILARRS